MRHLHFTVNKLLGRVANPRPVATIKTGRVAQPITDAFWCDLVNPSDQEKNAAITGLQYAIYGDCVARWLPQLAVSVLKEHSQ